tara:strand:+ start:221 stop:892 length:672 start_codon:yes stop_codon:yes gene_type:complete
MVRASSSDERAGTAAAEGAFVVVILIIISLAITFQSTEVIGRGVNIGDIAPELVAQAHTMGEDEWVAFNLADEIDPQWTDGDSGKHILIDFIDTDCPYCWASAAEMTEIHDKYGTQIKMFSVVVEFSDLSGHEGSRDEIIAYQEKIAGQAMCKASQVDCAEREGDPHPWPFIDDLDLSERSKWDVQGTPSYFLLKPNGEIAWTSDKNAGLSIDQAISAVLGGA